MKDICPLTGQPCPKKKLIHITDIAQGKAEETKNFCLDCAADYLNGTSPEDAKALKAKKLVEDFVKFLTVGPLPKKSNITYPDKYCPNCRTSLEHIATQGKLGCSQCYKVFREELKPLLITAQAGLKHVGKVPKQWQDKQKNVELEDRIMKAETEMQKAIVKERYEKAAECRDELARLRPIWEKKKKLSLDIARALGEGEFQTAQKLKEEISDLLKNLDL